MHVLITGAAGFLGRALTQTLAAGGHQVTALVHRPPSQGTPPWADHPKVRLQVVDLANLDTAALPQAVDALFTLAQSAHYRNPQEQAEDILAVNLHANLTLWRWAAQAGVSRLIHASTGAVYPGDSPNLHQEDHPLPATAGNFYAAGKRASELLLQTMPGSFTARVILRPFFIYGPGQNPGMLLARLIANCRAGQAIQLQGDGGLRINPIYIDDAAHLFAQALSLQGDHLINAAGPDTVSLRDIGREIGAIIKQEPVFEQREGAAPQLLADITRAKTLLGHPCTPFADGLRRMIQAEPSP